MNDLKTTYKICTKESKGSVTLDHLANKYLENLETHSNDEYKRNLKGITLKVFFVRSGHFAVAKNIVTISEGIVLLLCLLVLLLIMLFVTGNDKLVSKQDERVSKSEEQSSIEKSACSKYQILDFQSGSIQFQCGKKWYGLNQSTGFDALCLDEDDPEITIQAMKIMDLETKHLGN